MKCSPAPLLYFTVLNVSTSYTFNTVLFWVNPIIM